MVASDGSAKRVSESKFPRQGRYGQGVVAWKLPAKVRAVGLATGKGTTRITLHLKELAPKMVRLDAPPLQGRTARGRVIQKLKEGDRILFITVPWVVERPLAKSKGGHAKRERNKSAQRSSKPATRSKTGTRKRSSKTKS